MRRITSSVIGVIAVAAILIGINLFAETRLAAVQFDATQNRQYTLSRGTRTVLRGLKEPVTLRLFYSRLLGSSLPAYGAYADRVREMLEEYARISGGKVRLEYYNPEPFSETEDRALGYGLQGIPIDQTGQQIYFGLAGSNLLDDERNVPFFQPERARFLEYDLTRLVYELSNPTRPVVGVMSSLPLDGDPRMMMMARGQGGAGQPWVVMQQLRQSYTVRTVKTDVWTIDPDIQVLLVAQAQHLTDATLYAIDQFVMRGGRLMAMVDPDSEAESATPGPEGGPNTDVSSDLKKLFDAWGIQYDPNVVVGDPSGAWRVRANPGDRTSVVDYIAWFNIRDGIAKDDPATADLSQITVASAGALSLKPGTTGLEFKPLLTSSAQSGPIPAASTRETPDPSKILGAFKSEGGPRVIAARLRGPLKSAFTAVPDPAQGQERPANLPPFKASSDGAANLVIAADTDILADRYWVRVQDFFGQSQATPFSDNGALLVNLVGTLAGGDALIGLRSRGDEVRPFTVVDNMQHQAEARFRRTQQTLQAHLEATQKQLHDLREGNTAPGGAQATMTPEQQQAIEAASHEIVDTRRQLRNVQFQLNADIDHLQMVLRILDIVAVPALLTVIAGGIALVRRRQRARARA